MYVSCSNEGGTALRETTGREQQRIHYHPSADTPSSATRFHITTSLSRQLVFQNSLLFPRLLVPRRRMRLPVSAMPTLVAILARLDSVM